jgi:hypothetical protein
MNQNLFLFFDGWGMLGSRHLRFCLFHLTFAMDEGSKQLELLSKLMGFVTLISIFILSGCKGDLVALPIAFGASMVSALLVRMPFATYEESR